MKPYTKIFREAIETPEDLVKQLKNVLEKNWPSQGYEVKLGNSIGRPNIFIWATLGSNESEYENNIKHNDPLFHQWIVYGVSGGEKTGPVSILSNEPVEFGVTKLSRDSMEIDTTGIGGSISTNDYKRIKVGWRKKTKASPEQIVKHFEAYIKKLVKMAEDNKEKIDDIGGHL